jgi:hypothetical protein
MMGLGSQVKNKLIRSGAMISAMLVSALAVAQSLPVFGVARFGEAQFGVASATPVPFMPLWVLIGMALSLWLIAYKMKPGTH